MSNYRRLTTTDKYGKPVIYKPAALMESAVFCKVEAVQAYSSKMLVPAAYAFSGELVDALYEREENIAKYVEQAIHDMTSYLESKTPEGSKFFAVRIDDFYSEYYNLIAKYRLLAQEQNFEYSSKKVKRTANIKDFAEQVKKIIHKDENISDSEDEYLCEEIDSLLEEISNTEKSE